MQEAGTYPLVEEDDAEDFYSYLHSNLLDLKLFFQQNAEKGNAIIFYIM